MEPMPPSGRRLRVLLSAHACEPGRGSEPGVGWNVAKGLAQHHDVWVLTRAASRHAVEQELARVPVPGLHRVYYDLPGWPEHWRYRDHKLAMEGYYYLWQVGVYRKAQQLHQRLRFDLAHHLTFVRYWMPSLLSLLPVPFVWGPVGGGESAPEAFYRHFSRRHRLFERARDAARWLGERDPLVRQTAQRSRLALATTDQTAARLRWLGAPQCEVLGESGLTVSEVAALGATPLPADRPFRFISIGRLLHWKGFHLGLRAFAQARPEGAEYWIVGDGPDQARLQALVADLGLQDRVTFWGRLPRSETLERLGRSHVLVHPSLHDSGGWVCLEAMAARRPILCLDLGGPAYQVTPETGVKVAAGTPPQVVQGLAEAMRAMAAHPEACRRLGEAGHQRVRSHFTWDAKVKTLAARYEDVVAQPPARQSSSQAEALVLL